MKKLEKRDMLW